MQAGPLTDEEIANLRANAYTSPKKPPIIIWSDYLPAAKSLLLFLAGLIGGSATTVAVVPPKTVEVPGPEKTVEKAVIVPGPEKTIIREVPVPATSPAPPNPSPGPGRDVKTDQGPTVVMPGKK